MTAIWANEPRTSAQLTFSVPGAGFGSRTKMKIGIAKIANRIPAMRKIGSGDSVIPSRSRVSAVSSVPT